MSERTRTGPERPVAQHQGREMTARPPAPPPGATAAAPDEDPAGRLLAEVAQLRARTADRDRLLARAGAGLMGIAPVLGVAGYARSSMTNSPLSQNDATLMAVIGLTLAVVGTGLFLRYSFGEFLRFWMARLVAQQQQQQPVMPAPQSPQQQHPGPPAQQPLPQPRPPAPVPPARPAAAEAVPTTNGPSGSPAAPLPPRAPTPHRQEAT